LVIILGIFYSYDRLYQKELSCRGNQTSPEFSGATVVVVHLGDVYDNATGGGCIMVIF
jgi:hypothetical protein